MRSAASAIGWELGRRHRWGWAAVGIYILALAVFRYLAFEPGQSISFEDSRSFAFSVVVPAATAFMYFLAVFSFGLAGDLAGRESIYPTRLFTLPVTNGALAGWPMLYGGIAVAILWLAARLLGVWPEGADVPLIWPALLAVVVLSWTQAMTWMPYALPGMRVIVTVLLMSSINVVVLMALHYEASEPAMLVLLGPLLPIAYLAARFAVAQARRGDVPDWRQAFAGLGRLTAVESRRQASFSSPKSAQVWFEWRNHGRALPAMVAIVLPFELSLLFAFRDTPLLVFETLGGVLLTPVFLAMFVAATVSSANPHLRDARGISPFLATRPLTDVSFIAAKLKATIWSTFVTWLFVVAGLSLAIGLSGTSSIVADGAAQVVEAMGSTRAVTLGLLGLSFLFVATWRQLVHSLYIGLTGRSWLIKASVFVTLSLLTIIISLVPFVGGNREVIAALLDALPGILVALVCFKMAAAAWTAVRLYDSRLLSAPTLVIGAVLWNVAVFILYGLLMWLSPRMLGRSYVLLLISILVVPLVRLSLAPLALSWNRHR